MQHLALLLGTVHTVTGSLPRGMGLTALVTMLPTRMNVTSILVVIDEGLSSQFVLSSARVGAASSAQLHAGIHSKQKAKW